MSEQNPYQSATGKQWRHSVYDERLALAISQHHNIPLVAAQVMASRGIGLDEAGAFLSPRLREEMPDPYHLKDMDKAIPRLVAALIKRERITIFGDYDVDGATSSGLLLNYFRDCGVTAKAYIPDRMTEGYGPTIPAMEKLHADGTQLVITVDCGTTAFAPLARARDLGMDVIVIDHHISEPTLPDVTALLNPNRLDQDSPVKNLAAVGVVYLTLVALNSALDSASYFTEQRPKPNLLRYLDIVALGTVCDVVPLTGLNRALVAQGLKVLSHRENAGLRALADVGGVNEKPTAYHLGFVLGPRINAGGRVGKSSLGCELLHSTQAHDAERLARALDQYNRERKLIEEAVFDDATAQLEACPLTSNLAFAAGEGWHAGVIGIVAGRLKERYHVPTIVVSLDGDTGKASCRSVGRFDIGNAVIAAKQAGLLINGGGHAMAAGFTVARSQLDALKHFLYERVAHYQAASPLTPTVTIDSMITASGVTPALAEALQTLAPFGAGNPQPRLLITGGTLTKAQAFQSHVRCELRHEAHKGYLKAIAFRAMDSGLGAWMLSHQGQPVAVVGTVKLDTWGGCSAAALMIDDIAPAMNQPSLNAAFNVSLAAR